jgi:hypothetical protein
VASNQGSDGHKGSWRARIPFLRKATAGLSLRPPWWRMAVRRLVSGVLPGLRTGKDGLTSRQDPRGEIGRPRRESAPGRPLLARRKSLASKKSVLPTQKPAQRKAISAPGVIAAPKNTVIGGPVAGLTVASPMAHLVAMQPEQAEPEYASDYVAVQREAVQQGTAQPSLASTAPRSLARPPALTGSQSSPKRTVSKPVSPASPARPPSPEQRWREAVAKVPLESPRPFPTSMRPLVAQLAGSADRVSYTTGPATRSALAEVGALGATTGTTVHLAQQPSADPASMGVLAHELTHARSPISRPRFMLHSPTGSMDSDERHARTVGNQFDTAARSPFGTAGRATAPMRVQRLFGDLPKPSSLVSGLTDRATGAVGALGNQATSAVSGLADSATSELGNQAGALRERFSSAASDLSNRVTEEAGAVSAGLVDQLPVGGGANGVVGAVSQMARTVVENAVREATTTTMDEANRAVGQVSQAAQGMVGDLQNMASGGVNDVAGQANQWVNGAFTQAGNAVQAAGDQVGGAVGAAENAVSDGVNNVANKAMGAVSSALGPGAAQALAGPDLDRIVEALEERLLRQLERRGGRYAGVF